MQNNNRRKPERPKLYDSAKGIELSECLFCFRVYNKNLLSLQQSIIQDENYCTKCWRTEIMEKEYEDSLDIQMKKFWESGIDYHRVS
jgi:hypothetical protein